ncbi:MAG TPA: helix-turn-helix domain-containing protein, partial [Sphingorhabdus sp.]|nr:helix-turn-helix domain-containing protein [Sphingorhabdus sp.]
FCPVGRTAELIGDRAVILILRDLFFGIRRFDAFQANTGIGPQLLSDRLKRMEQDGVIEKRLYQQRPARHEYWLTEKGKALFDVLYAMRNWAERWTYTPDETGDGGPAMRYTHRKCGADVGLSTICPKCGETLGYGDLKGVMSPALRAERTAR